MADHANNLGKSTAVLLTKGAAWFIGLRWGVRGIGLVSTLILARLLVPGDFGLVSVATSYIAILDGLSELGLNFALIREDDAGRDEYDTAFTLNVIRGIGVASLVLISSLLVPGLVGDERLETVISLLALQPLLLGFANPKFVEFERNIDFSREARLQIGTKILGAAATISAAIAFRSYWALVAGLLVLAAAKLFWSYALAPYRPSLRLTSFRRLMSFSGWLAGAQMLTTISTRFDNILVGMLVDINAAGLYNVATEISRLPYAEIIHPLSRVLFPGFNRFTHDPARLRNKVMEAFQIVATIGIAVGAGFALVADEFIRLVLGATWEKIIPMVQLLSPFLSLEALIAVAVPFCMAVRYTRGLFQRALIMALFRPPLFIAGVLAMGYLGGVISAVISAVIFTALSIFMIAGMLQITPLHLCRTIVRPALGALATTLVVFAIHRALPAQSGQWVLLQVLLIKVFAGTTVFCTATAGMWHLEGKPPGIEARIYVLCRIFWRNRKIMSRMRA